MSLPEPFIKLGLEPQTTVELYEAVEHLRQRVRAAEKGRVDAIPQLDFAYARVIAGQSMPGVFVVHDRLAVQRAIEELLLLEACSEQAEWAGIVVYLPL